MSLDDAIKATRRLGLSYISLKDAHLPMNSTADQRREVAEKIKQAGLKLMGCGVVYMKNDRQEIRNAFEYARDAQIPTIVASPDPAAMDIVDGMVKEFDIKVAIHNHGPEDKHYPTPESVARAAEGRDPRIGLCIDIDHTTRAGLDPAREIRRYASRLYELHYKDVDKAAPGGKTIEAGRGVIDLPAVLKALLDIKFNYHVALEYEKDEYDPVPGMAESIGYTKGILAVMSRE
jgi:sugar phosphate isomerase/epimerase